MHSDRQKRLAGLGIPPPETELDYPGDLQQYLGRRVWESTVEEVYRHPESWNIFIKPKSETKAFTGLVVRVHRDFIGLSAAGRPTVSGAQKPLILLLNGGVLYATGDLMDVRRYKGDWTMAPDETVILAAIRDFKNAPVAYALDFGIDATGCMKLVEVNDAHSLGTYGLGAVSYAKMLSARWAELTGTKDSAFF